jgi:uncharacterized protein YndB with AHSA1/START domain
MKYVLSIEIDAPPERVFAWFGSGEAVKRWLPSLVETEDLEIKADYVGSRFRHVYVEHGRRMEMRGEVTAYEPSRRYACALDGDAFALTVDYRFEPIGAGRTRLTQESETRFKGAVMRVIGALTKPFVRRLSLQQARQAFGRLKQLAEAAGPEV